MFEFQKSDDPAIFKGVAKNIIPVPTDVKSYALTLHGFLGGACPYEPDMKFKNILQSLNTDREIFIDYYKFMKKGHGLRVFNAYDMFMKLDTGANADKYNLYQFMFCAIVFKQLGILSFVGGLARINDTNSTDLFLSSAYNMVREQKLDVKAPVTSKKDVTA